MVTTGSLPLEPPIEGLSELGAWTSREGTSATEVPEALVIVGGGAVGCGGAGSTRMGSRVSVVQSDDHLLPRVDREAGELLAEVLTDDGVHVLTGTKPAAVEGAEGASASRARGSSRSRSRGRTSSWPSAAGRMSRGSGSSTSRSPSRRRG